MLEDIITEVLRKVIDLEPEVTNRFNTALYMVLNGYEITPKCTEVRVIDNSWLDDLDRFCDRKKLSGKSEGTIERYRYVLRKVLGFINKPIKDITEGDLNLFIETYKRINKVSNSTLEGIRLCISSFFTWQHERGYIPSNIVCHTCLYLSLFFCQVTISSFKPTTLSLFIINFITLKKGDIYDKSYN